MSHLIDFTWRVSDLGYEWRKTVGYPSGQMDAGVTGRYIVDKAQPYQAYTVINYPPFKETGLFRIFAETEPTEDGILAFADEYGLLGGELKIGVQVPIPGEPNNFITSDGEMLKVWKFQIEAMRHCVQLWDAASKGNANFLSDYIEWRGKGLAVESPYLEVMYRGPRVAGAFSTSFEIASERNNPEVLGRFRSDDVVGPAWYALQSLINSKLRDHRALPKLLWNHKKPRKLEVHIAPQSLIAALWLQLANGVAENKEYRQCDECNRWFAVGELIRQDGKYCRSACRSKAYRGRQEGSRKLYAQGLPIKEIAAKIGSDVKTVQRWVNSKEAKH